MYLTVPSVLLQSMPGKMLCLVVRYLILLFLGSKTSVKVYAAEPLNADDCYSQSKERDLTQPILQSYSRWYQIQHWLKHLAYYKRPRG